MMNLAAAARTDKGKEREANEDRVWSQVFSASGGEPIGLFIVCDGMGGHLAGEIASQLAMETVKHELSDLFQAQDPRLTVRLEEGEMPSGLVAGNIPATRQALSSRMDERVTAAIQRANLVVYEYGRRKSEARDAGTTLTLALVQGSRAIIANVGDSRTYLLRDHQLRQVTQDHSLVASLVASGQIRPEEVFTHPQRNVIYRSLGQKQRMPVDIFVETLQPGDTLLLCSDGLWEMLRTSREIGALLESESDPALICQQLIDAANRAGGEDNIGVVVVKLTASP